MNGTTFKALDLGQQASVIWEKGTYLDHRIVYGKYKVCIYAVLNFYVEVYYDVVHNQIKKIVLLESTADWEAYLNTIDLNYLKQ